MVGETEGSTYFLLRKGLPLFTPRVFNYNTKYTDVFSLNKVTCLYFVEGWESDNK